MDLGKQFATDGVLEEEGVWVDLDTESKIKVARMGNKRYKEAFRRLTAPHKISIRNNNLNDDLAEQLLTQALAEGVLLDWEGMTLKGKPLVYSQKTAIEVLMNPSLKDFRELVVSIASDMESYRQQEQEEVVKNS